jgi:hypothetical protein
MLRDTDKKGNGKRAATVQASPAMGFILPQTYNLSLVLSQPQVIFFTSNASPSGFFFFFKAYLTHHSYLPFPLKTPSELASKLGSILRLNCRTNS